MVQTMQSVLQVGPFDRAASPLYPRLSGTRLALLRKTMAQEGSDALVVFGDRFDYSNLNWITGYAPRLNGALALVAAAGTVRILTYEGVRMAPAGQETAWDACVEPFDDIAEVLTGWLEDLGPAARVSTCDFALLNESKFLPVGRIARLAAAVDATPTVARLRRRKDAAEIEALREAGRVLSAAEDALRRAVAGGALASAALARALHAALAAGAQDVRALTSLDGGVGFNPPGLSAEEEDGGDLVAYLAVRLWGYWIDGFVSVRPMTSDGDRRASAVLDGLVALAVPGTPATRLAKAFDDGLDGQERPDILARDGCGNGLGTALHEAPDLTDPIQVLQDGDVLTLRAACHDGPGRISYDSVVVHVTAAGPRILWSPADHCARRSR